MLKIKSWTKQLPTHSLHLLTRCAAQRKKLICVRASNCCCLLPTAVFLFFFELLLKLTTTLNWLCLSCYAARIVTASTRALSAATINKRRLGWRCSNPRHTVIYALSTCQRSYYVHATWPVCRFLQFIFFFCVYLFFFFAKY